MEDLIIIALGIAVAAYSAFRKNKRAKEAGSESASESNERVADDYQGETTESDRDYLEEYFGKESDYSSNQERGYNEPVQGQERFKNPRLEDAYKKVRERQQSSLPEEMEFGKESIATQDKYAKTSYDRRHDLKPADKKRRQAASRRRSDSKTMHHWFNLRRAIIYSEILNRKY